MNSEKNELAKKFFGVPTGNLCDSLKTKCAMHSSIKPVFAEAKFAGLAYTVSCPPGDNLTIHKALHAAPAGSVLVIDARSYTEGSVIGDIIALAARLKGLEGIVVDGSSRDTEEIEALGFPVFSRALHPYGTVKETLGSIGEPVQCGGVLVNPADIVVGDRDGVIVIPYDYGLDVLEKASGIEEKENKVREQLKQGKTTLEIFSLDTVLKNKGYDI